MENTVPTIRDDTAVAGADRLAIYSIPYYTGGPKELLLTQIGGKWFLSTYGSFTGTPFPAPETW